MAPIPNIIILIQKYQAVYVPFWFWSEATGVGTELMSG